MSQIGKKPINIPDGINVNNNDNNISVEGKLGLLEYQFDKRMKINIDISKSSTGTWRNSDIDTHFKTALGVIGNSISYTMYQP